MLAGVLPFQSLVYRIRSLVWFWSFILFPGPVVNDQSMPFSCKWITLPWPEPTCVKEDEREPIYRWQVKMHWNTLLTLATNVCVGACVFLGENQNRKGVTMKFYNDMCANTKCVSGSLKDVILYVSYLYSHPYSYPSWGQRFLRLRKLIHQEGENTSYYSIA